MTNDFIEVEIKYLDTTVGEIVLYSNGSISNNINDIGVLKTTCDKDIFISLSESLIELFTHSDYKTLHSELQKKLINGLNWNETSVYLLCRYLFSRNGKFDLGNNIHLLNIRNFRMSIFLSKMIFIINGSGGVGKDTFINFIRKYVLVINNISSIDPVRNIYKTLDIDIENKNEENRKLLSDTKHFLDEKINFTENYITRKLNYFLDEEFSNIKNRSTNKIVSDMVFVHIREPENINKIANKFSVYTILMKNNNVKQILSNDADANVDKYKYDILIKNNGSEDDLEELANLLTDACSNRSFPILFK